MRQTRTSAHTCCLDGAAIVTPPKLNNRQKLLVTLLQEAGGTAPRISFMKWLFLLSQETDWGISECPYEFVPYRYGPFSFVAYHDLRKLESMGVVQQAEGAFVLCEGDAPGSSTALDAVREVVGKYGQHSPDELMADVYSRYDWFAMLTERPELAEHIPQRGLAEPAVYTLGYAGRNLDGFLYLLLERELAGVIDVRSSPRSRVYGFAGTTLERNLGELGLQYVAMPELGIPSEARQDIGSTAKRSALLEQYGEWLDETQTDSVAQVAALMTDAPLALMCMESEATDCHRSVLATAVNDVAGLGVTHL